MSISKATPDDVKALNALINSAYRGESSKQGWTTEADMLDGMRTDEEDLKSIISKPGCMMLKCTNDNNEIIGCVRLEKHGNRLYLGMLTVSPVLQGGGIGKQLMAEAEKTAKEMSCNTVYMGVIDGRTELIDWYKRHGYNDTGKREPFPEASSRFGIPKKKLEFIMLEKSI